MADVPKLEIIVDAEDLNSRDNGINQVLAKLRKDWKSEDIQIKVFVH
jgi:anti-anti-sigma regulatory factor